MSKLLQRQYDEVLRENVDLIAQSERLLSKIDIAEKALEDVIFETDVPVSDVAAIKRLSEEALQQLRS
jgi:hypothetical protein